MANDYNAPNALSIELNLKSQVYDTSLGYVSSNALSIETNFVADCYSNYPNPKNIVFSFPKELTNPQYSAPNSILIESNFRIKLLSNFTATELNSNFSLYYQVPYKEEQLRFVFTCTNEVFGVAFVGLISSTLEPVSGYFQTLTYYGTFEPTTNTILADLELHHLVIQFNPTLATIVSDIECQIPFNWLVTVDGTTETIFSSIIGFHTIQGYFDTLLLDFIPDFELVTPFEVSVDFVNILATVTSNFTGNLTVQGNLDSTLSTIVSGFNLNVRIEITFVPILNVIISNFELVTPFEVTVLFTPTLTTLISSISGRFDVGFFNPTLENLNSTLILRISVSGSILTNTQDLTSNFLGFGAIKIEDFNPILGTVFAFISGINIYPILINFNNTFEDVESDILGVGHLIGVFYSPTTEEIEDEVDSFPVNFNILGVGHVLGTITSIDCVEYPELPYEEDQSAWESYYTCHLNLVSSILGQTPGIKTITINASTASLISNFILETSLYAALQSNLDESDGSFSGLTYFGFFNPTVENFSPSFYGIVELIAFFTNSLENISTNIIGLVPTSIQGSIYLQNDIEDVVTSFSGVSLIQGEIDTFIEKPIFPANEKLSINIHLQTNVGVIDAYLSRITSYFFYIDFDATLNATLTTITSDFLGVGHLLIEFNPILNSIVTNIEIKTPLDYQCFLIKNLNSITSEIYGFHLSTKLVSISSVTETILPNLTIIVSLFGSFDRNLQDLSSLISVKVPIAIIAVSNVSTKGIAADFRLLTSIQGDFNSQTDTIFSNILVATNRGSINPLLSDLTSSIQLFIYAQTLVDLTLGDGTEETESNLDLQTTFLLRQNIFNIYFEPTLQNFANNDFIALTPIIPQPVFVTLSTTTASISTTFVLANPIIYIAELTGLQSIIPNFSIQVPFYGILDSFPKTVGNLTSKFILSHDIVGVYFTPTLNSVIFNSVTIVTIQGYFFSTLENLISDINFIGFVKVNLEFELIDDFFIFESNILPAASVFSNIVLEVALVYFGTLDTLIDNNNNELRSFITVFTPPAIKAYLTEITLINSSCNFVGYTPPAGRLESLLSRIPDNLIANFLGSSTVGLMTSTLNPISNIDIYGEVVPEIKIYSNLNLDNCFAQTRGWITVRVSTNTILKPVVFQDFAIVTIWGRLSPAEIEDFEIETFFILNHFPNPVGTLEATTEIPIGNLQTIMDIYGVIDTSFYNVFPKGNFYGTTYPANYEVTILKTLQDVACVFVGEYKTSIFAINNVMFLSPVFGVFSGNGHTLGNMNGFLQTIETSIDLITPFNVFVTISCKTGNDFSEIIADVPFVISGKFENYCYTYLEMFGVGHIIGTISSNTGTFTAEFNMSFDRIYGTFNVFVSQTLFTFFLGDFGAGHYLGFLHVSELELPEGNLIGFAPLQLTFNPILQTITCEFEAITPIRIYINSNIVLEKLNSINIEGRIPWQGFINSNLETISSSIECLFIPPIFATISRTLEAINNNFIGWVTVYVTINTTLETVIPDFKCFYNRWCYLSSELGTILENLYINSYQGHSDIYPNPTNKKIIGEVIHDSNVRIYQERTGTLLSSFNTVVDSEKYWYHFEKSVINNYQIISVPAFSKKEKACVLSEIIVEYEN